MRLGRSWRRIERSENGGKVGQEDDTFVPANQLAQIVAPPAHADHGRLFAGVPVQRGHFMDPVSANAELDALAIPFQFDDDDPAFDRGLGRGHAEGEAQVGDRG